MKRIKTNTIPTPVQHPKQGELHPISRHPNFERLMDLVLAEPADDASNEDTEAA